MSNSLSGLVSVYRSLKEQQAELVLATIIETQGSTYRKAGSRILITPEGDCYGMLGDNALHASLFEFAERVFTSHQPLFFTYTPKQEVASLDGDQTVLHILLQYLSQENAYEPMESISRRLSIRQQDVLVTVYESEIESIAVGKNLFVSTITKHDHTLDKHLQEEIRQIGEDLIRTGKVLCCEHFTDNQAISLFYSPIEPPLSLLILGSGPDAIPVVHFAKQLGWNVTIADTDEFMPSLKQFSEADRIAVIRPDSDQADELMLTAQAIVIMTHDLERDKGFLIHACKSQAMYIGLLGSVKRRDKILASQDINENKLRNRLYSPVGLELGGELPEEIALSLTAEIQKVMSERKKSTPTLHDICTTPASMDKLAAVILAAGGSNRFGGLKQLLEYNGMSLLRRSVETARAAFSERVHVVLGPKELKMQRELNELEITMLSNPNWESGLASSIKVGLKAVPDECSAVLFMLCDQPLITVQHLGELIALWQGNQDKIIASHDEEIETEPAIIPRNYFPEILKLYGDQGIKQVLNVQTEHTLHVSIPEAAIDIDTQEDYMRLLTGTETK